MDKELTEEHIFSLCKRVIDPELMINIVDLGLVYKAHIDEASKAIEVDMTLTSRGCPLGDVIMEEVECVLKNEYEDFDIGVNLVWEPMWTLDRLTEVGKAALGRA